MGSVGGYPRQEFRNLFIHFLSKPKMALECLYMKTFPPEPQSTCALGDSSSGHFLGISSVRNFKKTGFQEILSFPK